MKTCNHCSKEIKWPEPYVKGNLPLNLDGSEHRCKGKEPTLGQSMQKTAEAFEKLNTQESLAGLEDIEKADLQAKDFNDEIIGKQIAFLDKIEKRVKAHLTKTQGSNFSVQQLGLWVKLIYQNMSS